MIPKQSKIDDYTYTYIIIVAICNPKKIFLKAATLFCLTGQRLWTHSDGLP